MDLIHFCFYYFQRIFQRKKKSMAVNSMHHMFPISNFTLLVQNFRTLALELSRNNMTSKLYQRHFPITQSYDTIYIFLLTRFTGLIYFFLWAERFNVLSLVGTIYFFRLFIYLFIFCITQNCIAIFGKLNKILNKCRLWRDLCVAFMVMGFQEKRNKKV